MCSQAHLTAALTGCINASTHVAAEVMTGRFFTDKLNSKGEHRLWHAEAVLLSSLRPVLKPSFHGRHVDILESDLH